MSERKEVPEGVCRVCDGRGSFAAESCTACRGTGLVSGGYCECPKVTTPVLCGHCERPVHEGSTPDDKDNDNAS
jgi:ribosomal protein L40E